MKRNSSFVFDTPAEEALLKEACNLRAIYAFDQGKDVVIIAHEPSTSIKSALYINQYSGVAVGREWPATIKSHGAFFSFYAGQIVMADVRKLIFVSSVRRVDCDEKPIFIVEEAVVYTLQPFALDATTTRAVRAFFAENCLFSYTTALSSDTAKRIRRCWPFWLNHHVQWDLLATAREWAVPLVAGFCRLNPGQDYEALSLCRPSIFNCHPPYRQDKDVFWDFSCPASLFSVDMHVSKDRFSYRLRITFCHLPRGAAPLRAKAAGDTFESSLQPHKIARFYQFMHSFTGCDRFYVTGSRAWTEKMRPFPQTTSLERGGFALTEQIPEELKGFMHAYAEFSSSAEEDFHLIANSLKAEIRNIEGESTIACAIVVDQYSDFCFYIAQLAYAELHQQLKRRLAANVQKEPADFIQDLEFIKTHMDNFVDAERRGRSCLKEAPAAFLRAFYGRKSQLSRGYRRVMGESKADVFSTRSFSLGILTHNTSGCLPSEVQDATLNYGRLGPLASSDVLIIALQEIVEMKGYNIGLILRSENTGSCNYWEQKLRMLFPAHVFVARTSLLGLYLAVLVRSSRRHDLQVAVSKHALFPLGFMNLANKGGLFINFRLNYENVGVMNCHLTAGGTAAEATKRAASLVRLCETVFSGTRSALSFLVGDFNFRRNNDELAKELVAAGSPPQLPLIQRGLQGDEWRTHRLNFPELRGLEEAPIAFYPTYKMQPFAEMRYVPERCPAWTDRVLFCNHEALALTDVLYGADTKTTFSDHQPVFFSAQLPVREIDIVKFREYFN